MPYLNIQTNVHLDDSSRASLLKNASQTVASVLGKPESYVMVHLDSGNDMLFAGNDAPLAYLQLKSLGLPESETRAFSHSIFSVSSVSSVVQACSL